MANTSYTTNAAINTLAKRKAAYAALSNLFAHLDGYNVNLLSMVLNANNTITFVISNPFPDQVQLDRWDVVSP